MSDDTFDPLRLSKRPSLRDGTLILSFGGWMDGGDVSTGTVQRVIDHVGAEPIGEIDGDGFHILNVPGPMEVAALFRPHVRVEDGLVDGIDMPENVFYADEETNLLLFNGREPNLRWGAFAEAIFEACRECGVQRILFVGSFGGTVPHTREPRLYVACSKPELVEEMQQYGVRATGYEGPGSFTSYLLSRADEAGFEMISLVAEIPGYLQGPNPTSIAAVTRRLAMILQLPLDLDALRTASTEWEMQVSNAVEDDEDMAQKVREMERLYDDELLEQNDA